MLENNYVVGRGFFSQLGDRSGVPVFRKEQFGSFGVTGGAVYVKLCACLIVGVKQAWIDEAGTVLEQVNEIEGIETGLMADAQRFIVLGQTDSLWKEHLQASAPFACLHALYIAQYF